MISLFKFQLFILLGVLNFSRALPAYLPVQNCSSSVSHFSTLTTFTTFIPTVFPTVSMPQNTSSVPLNSPSISTSIVSRPCQNTTLTLSPTSSAPRGILVVTTTIERHHFVEVAPVTVTSVEKMTETHMEKVTETQMQKMTETKLVTVTASGGAERVTETSIFTVTESGVTITLLPLPSSSSSTVEIISTMTTIAIVTTDVTSFVTATLTSPTTEAVDATTSAAKTGAPELTTSTEPAPISTTTEAAVVVPTSTVEPSPVITTTPAPTTEEDTGLRSSTLLHISISRLVPPPEPAFATIAPVITEAPIVSTPAPVVAGGDPQTPSTLPDWDDIKEFTKTFSRA